MPIGTPTQKMAFQCHSERKPPINNPRNDPATAATMLTPERHAALVGGERVGQDRRGGRHQHRSAHTLEHAPTISHSAPPPRWNGSNDSAIAATVKTMKPRL